MPEFWLTAMKNNEVLADEVSFVYNNFLYLVLL